jgi:glycosyltransferase involved in cell wall biosynthesis
MDNGYYDLACAQNTVIIDYRDDMRKVYPNQALAYFKRSVVDKANFRFHQFSREVIPISYSVRNEFLDHGAIWNAERNIDIAVFFNPSPALNKTQKIYYRTQVAQYVAREFETLNIFVGILGKSGASGRNSYQAEYFELMQRCKIVVTCNPDRWEGDYRLFEALCSGALVIVDNMLTPLANSFKHRSHLVYYDREDISVLGNLIREFLSDSKERERIAKNGHSYTLEKHTASSRIDEILDHSIRALQNTEDQARKFL